jgi:hypothetical protein
MTEQAIKDLGFEIQHETAESSGADRRFGIITQWILVIFV